MKIFSLIASLIIGSSFVVDTHAEPWQISLVTCRDAPPAAGVPEAIELSDREGRLVVVDGKAWLAYGVGGSADRIRQLRSQADPVDLGRGYFAIHAQAGASPFFALTHDSFRLTEPLPAKWRGIPRLDIRPNTSPPEVIAAYGEEESLVSLRDVNKHDASDEHYFDCKLGRFDPDAGIRYLAPGTRSKLHDSLGGVILLVEVVLTQEGSTFRIQPFSESGR